MTPVKLNRLGIYASQLSNPLGSGNLIALVILKVKAAAIIIIPLIALFFLYQIFSDPKAEKIISFSAVSFNKLKLSSDNKQSIEFILENLAQKNKWWLCKNSTIMNEHGDKIDKVHPLKFISFVLSNNKLKNTYLSAILNDRFKKISFMSGLTQSLKKTHQSNQLEPYLDDFMLSLSFSQSKKEKLKVFIDKEDWHGFFYFLKDNSKCRLTFF